MSDEERLARRTIHGGPCGTFVRFTAPDARMDRPTLVLGPVDEARWRGGCLYVDVGERALLVAWTVGTGAAADAAMAIHQTLTRRIATRRTVYRTSFSVGQESPRDGEFQLDLEALVASDPEPEIMGGPRWRSEAAIRGPAGSDVTVRPRRGGGR